MKPLLLECARGALGGSVAAILVLTFAWPLVVSPDPDQPAFRIGAIATLLLFLVSVLVLLAGRITSRR